MRSRTANPDLADQLYVVEAKGLSAAAALDLLTQREPAAAVELRKGDAMTRHRWVLDLRRRGLLGPRQTPRWPEAMGVEALAERLRTAGVRLAWRGGPGYPERLTASMGPAAPTWCWLAGDPARLSGLSCAIVGSRKAGVRWIEATRRLASALAASGVTVVSGLAAGVDMAAHRGAAGHHRGTVGVPACGVLKVDPGSAGMPGDRVTYLALDRPEAPFSAGLALRRNDVIAAFGGAVVLAASGLRGGSTYAVKWALAHGRPLWCFDDGRHTPSGNRSLLHGGRARPLPLDWPPEQWAHAIGASLTDAGRAPEQPGCTQPDLLEGADQSAR